MLHSRLHFDTKNNKPKFRFSQLIRGFGRISHVSNRTISFVSISIQTMLPRRRRNEEEMNSQSPSTRTRTSPPTPPTSIFKKSTSFISSSLLWTPLALSLYAVLLISNEASYAHAAEHNVSSLSSTEKPILNRNHDESPFSLQRIKTSLVGQYPQDKDNIHILDLVLFGTLILLALELLNTLVKYFGKPGWLGKTQFIPVRGKHLDDLSKKDILFIGLNKAATPPFVYFFIRYMYYEPNMMWDLSKATLVR